MTTQRRGAYDYEAVKEARRQAEQAERLRLYYVAMTRAKERLIVSGSVDFGKASEVPAPIAWVLERLRADEELAAAGDAPVELVRDEARLLVRVDRYREPAAEAVEAIEEAQPEAGQLALFAGIEEVGAAVPPAPTLPPLVSVAEPPLLRVRRLSFTALSTFEQCGYKYWARYGIGLAEQPAPHGEEDGMSGVEVGSRVHELLEGIDLAAPVVPEIEDERIRGLVAAYCESELARRVAALPEVAKERHFTFEHDDVLVHGFLDVFQIADSRALVVDYKTNLLGEASPEEIVEEDYRLQRLVYAIACFRAGAEEVEVVYQFLERPDAPVEARFTLADVPELEAELSAAIARIQAGEFRPTPSELACAGCPALDLVCAGPRLRRPPAELVAS